MAHPIIVCYVGGTAGDIISQILDPSEFSSHRQKLKKPHLFANDQEKNSFLETSGFASVPSHDFEYHRNYNHKLLGIICQYTPDSLWAAHRFKKLHRPQVWKEMTAFCGADTEEVYAQAIIDFGKMLASYTSNVLYLDDIINGRAIARLHELGYQTPGKYKYKKWLLDNETSNNYTAR